MPGGSEGLNKVLILSDTFIKHMSPLSNVSHVDSLLTTVLSFTAMMLHNDYFA
jgi:hypothetical protein